MPFVFSLQALLRLREVREEEELQRLLTLSSQTAALRAEVAALEALHSEQRRLSCQQALQEISGAELHFDQRRSQSQEELRRSLLERLEQLEKSWRAQQALYLEARRQRQAISALREQQRICWEHDQDRREQRTIDALFLLRYVQREPDLENS